jgi:hypothetical protein
MGLSFSQETRPANKLRQFFSSRTVLAAAYVPIWDALQFMLAAVLELDPRSRDEVLDDRGIGTSSAIGCQCSAGLMRPGADPST